jgi:uncharacterized membrane protein
MPPTPSTTTGPLAAARSLESAAVLDRLAVVVDRLSGAVVPAGRAHDVLRGRSLGHPLHAVLTDLPLGLWSSAVALDLTGPEKYADASRRLVGLGLLMAVPTVLAGLADFPALGTRARRVAAVHAAVNGLGNALFATSFLARHRGRRRLGAALSVAGMGVAGAGGFLGGHVAGGLHEPAPPTA